MTTADELMAELGEAKDCLHSELVRGRKGRLHAERAEETIDRYQRALKAIARRRNRAELAEELVAALLAVDPAEWALAGQHAGADAAQLTRRIATTPTSKEQQR